MLMPKRVKYRKTHRGRRQGPATRGTEISFGEFGLVAEEAAWIESKQIEAARRAITHYLKRGGQIWIRVFPDKSVTAKPAETRMGSGKGAPDHWVAVVKPGRVLFEVGGIKEDVAKEALTRAGFKLPIATRFAVRAGGAAATAEAAEADEATGAAEVAEAAEADAAGAPTSGAGE